jgi:hypothetical protein
MYVILNGGDVITFTNNKVQEDVRHIYMPKNTVLISSDSKGKWSRSIGEAGVKRHHFREYKSEDMYTLLINWT